MYVRIIPCLLIRNRRLIKTIQFKNEVYIGCPINAARIFSCKQADEIILLDIGRSIDAREPDYEIIAAVAGECSMPVTYGGGIKNFEQARRILRAGVEKVVINTGVMYSYDLIRQIADAYGSQAVVGGIDVKATSMGGYSVFARSASKVMKVSLEAHLQNFVEAGVGEIFLNSVDRDGTMIGYDLPLVRSVSRQVGVPVIACGGAGTMNHLAAAIDEGGASAVAVGSMFIFTGAKRAVMINYPRDRMSII